MQWYPLHPNCKRRQDDHCPVFQNTKICQALQVQQDHEYLPLFVFLQDIAIPRLNTASALKEQPLGEDIL